MRKVLLSIVVCYSFHVSYSLRRIISYFVKKIEDPNHISVVL